MFRFSKHSLAGVIVASAFAQSAAAQTATAEFDVTIQITDECVIVSAQDLDFGSVGTLTSAKTAASDIVVNCTSGADYSIALDEGTGGGTTASRVMTNASETISYHLYTTSGYATAWGESTEALSSTGTGSEQTFTVYGRVPVQATPPAGDYKDTIGVTVTY